MIPKTLIEKFEKRLKKEEEEIENQLKRLAQKNKDSDDWQMKYPSFNGEKSLEEEADEVEEYENLLAVERSLEAKLKDIKVALGKIKKGNYGICEKCKKEIELERLKIIPETRFCKNCKK